MLNLSQEPDIAFIPGQSVKDGRPVGFAAMMGIWAGAIIHVLMAAIGLSAVVIEPPLVIAGSRLAMGLKAQIRVNGWIEGWEHYPHAWHTASSRWAFTIVIDSPW